MVTYAFDGSSSSHHGCSCLRHVNSFIELPCLRYLRAPVLAGEIAQGQLKESAIELPIVLSVLDGTGVEAQPGEQTVRWSARGSKLCIALSRAPRPPNPQRKRLRSEILPCRARPLGANWLHRRRSRFCWSRTHTRTATTARSSRHHRAA